MDVLAVREATLRAVERARKEYLPTLLEFAPTVSWPLDVGSRKLRTRAEIERYQERDPLKLFSASLKEEGVLSDSEFQAIEAEVKEQVEKAVRFAEESPFPDPKELYTDVYATPIKPGRT